MYWRTTKKQGIQDIYHRVLPLCRTNTYCVAIALDQVSHCTQARHANARACSLVSSVLGASVDCWSVLIHELQEQEWVRAQMLF
jgi:hypothetical protein